MTQPVELWFEFASTYSYPAVMRAEASCAERGIELRWRPFLLGPIFADLGMDDSPFNLNQVKGAYMWRDLERICAAQGLPFRRPSHFPRGSILASRIAHTHVAEPWVGAFIRAVYAANFGADRDIGDPDCIRAILGDLDLEADTILLAATTPEAKAALRNSTRQAQAHGIFGAPTLRVGSELFWGNDRLETALDWAIR